MVSDALLKDADQVDRASHWRDSSLAWCLRGLMLSAIVIGSANAVSFFVHSQGWGSLLGNRAPNDEAIGFPMIVWKEGSGYGSHTLSLIPFGVNVAATLLLGGLIGWWAIWQRPILNQMMERFRGNQFSAHFRFQFSLRGLLIVTMLAAIAAAGVRAFTPQVEVLAAIYALGPVSLIVLAYLPPGLTWQQRVSVLTPATLILIAAAIALGDALNVEFDKVLLGIFICWTPQATIAAIVIIAWLLAREYVRLTDAGVKNAST